MSVLGDYLARIKRMTRRSDPITSFQAAEVAEKHISRTARNVLAYARTVGERGFTDLEMENFLCDGTSNSRSRRRELVDKGLIVDTGKRLRLHGDTRHRIVWRAK